MSNTSDAINQPSPTEPKVLNPETMTDNKTESRANEELGIGIKSEIRPLLSSWLEPHRRYDPDESYFPFPKITFLIDQPKGLLCQICRGAKCRIKSGEDRLGDSTFSILPCGHVAGSRCIKTWLKECKTCPFCRFTMKYPGCGHNIPAHLMTKENLHLLPRTLPDKGVIPDQCDQCHKDKLLTQAMSKFQDAVNAFEQARSQFHEIGGVKEKEAMFEKREIFENIMRDEAYLPQLSTWLTSW